MFSVVEGVSSDGHLRPCNNVPVPLSPAGEDFYVALAAYTL